MKKQERVVHVLAKDNDGRSIAVDGGEGLQKRRVGIRGKEKQERDVHARVKDDDWQCIPVAGGDRLRKGETEQKGPGREAGWTDGRTERS